MLDWQPRTNASETTVRFGTGTSRHDPSSTTAGVSEPSSHRSPPLPGRNTSRTSTDGSAHRRLFCRDRHRLSCPKKRLLETTEHREVGVEPNSLQAAHPERGEAVVVLQPSELALDGGAGPVEVAEALSVALDAREEAPAESERQGCLLSLRSTERDDRRLRQLRCAASPRGAQSGSLAPNNPQITRVASG